MAFLRFVATVVCLLGAAGLAGAQSEQPVITSIRLEGSNVVVTAQAPPGSKRLTLECRDRLGRGHWAPGAVARLDSSGGPVTFRVPISRQAEMLRVRADLTDPLPSSFYSGQTSFTEPSAGAAGTDPFRAATTYDGVVVGPTANPAPAETRAVVESDIWRIRGPRLYFFNQYRGLQIIDVSHPDSAVVRGTLALPAAGEQMYLLGDNHAVLLARDGCGWSPDGPESQVLVVNLDKDDPKVRATMPVKGYVQESRLVGTALYVASQMYRAVPNGSGSTWEWGTLVSAFDLADPAAPIARNTLWYPGYGNAVAATDVYLFVVTQVQNDWWRSVVRCVDITAPNGTLQEFASITMAGQVADKFKLNWSGSVLTAISQVTSGGMLATKLETFRLPHPASLGPLGVVKLGELGLAMGERLFATRFDGDRVYVVTFGTRIQIDPLWIIDLSDATRPRITGELVVPGFSTFLYPLGDRVVAIGVETNQVGVSLFDVANATRPNLLSRVLLGQRFSWSEANTDEKAFNVMPEAGLILVPFASSSSNGYLQAVQLVDLNRDSLRARGVIEHTLQPRRAALLEDAARIVSISGRELLSLDPTDRDAPVVRGVLPLAWSVDRVFLRGDHLLELATSAEWGSETGPTLRVALADSPPILLNALTLTNLPVWGATVRGDYLYLAQGTIRWIGPEPASPGGTVPARQRATTFLLTVIDLSRLPQLSVHGQVEAQPDLPDWVGNLDAVWPNPGTLVWAGGGSSFWWYDWGRPIPLLDFAAPAVIGWPWWPPFWGGSGGELVAFDVNDPAAPRFVSALNLQGTNGWWNFSKPFSSGGLVYLSHQTAEFIPGPDPVDPTLGPVPADALIADPSIRVIYPWRIGTWTYRSFLDVVDYADPANPVVRKAVNIPGQLHGLSHNGALLYTLGTTAVTNRVGQWAEALSASAYDGVAAHFVDAIPLPEVWPHPVLVTGTNVFVGRPGYDALSTNVGPHRVESWTLPDSGRFVRLGQTTLDMPASLLAEFPGMLAAQHSDNAIALLDFRDPSSLRRIGQGQPPGCAWFNLEFADGDSSRGLWLPLGLYGVATISVTP